MRKPSPATVLATIALFVALGGAGMAATGGTFILGKQNTADQTSTLSSTIATGPTLQLGNSGGRPAAKFNTAGSVSPFSVGSAAKVQSLNADLLDGIDSSGFTQGGGHVYSAHLERVAPNAEGVLLAIPGALTVSYLCTEFWNPYFQVDKSGLDVVLERQIETTPPQFTPPQFFDANSSPITFGAGPPTIFAQMLASRLATHTTPPFFADVQLTGAHDDLHRGCTFQAFAVVFG
jgi:hypothetical protein